MPCGGEKYRELVRRLSMIRMEFGKSGSRYSDGNVPNVNWNVDNQTVNVNWYNASDHNPNFAVRPEVSTAQT